MSQPAGTVRRYWMMLRIEEADGQVRAGVNPVAREDGAYVMYADHKAAMDLLAAQAVALATAIVDSYEVHCDCAACANIEQAQALLDAQGRKG